jgi:Tol biopolymer transport system component
LLLSSTGLAASDRSQKAKSVGTIQGIVASVTAGGHAVGPGVKESLVAGESIATGRQGRGRITLKLGSATWSCYAEAKPGKHGLMRVAPRQADPFDLQSGRAICAGPKGARVFKSRLPHGTAEYKDPVFEIVVTKRKSVVKVQRGVVVVAAAAAPAQAVVVGRHQQTTMSRGQAPTGPEQVELDASETARFKQVQATLPPVTDNTAPTPRIDSAPSRPLSSLRDATFTFGASEPGSTLSCAFDGGEFRLCTSPQRFADLPAGNHTFQVKASDATGNTSAATSFSWEVDGSLIAFARNWDGNFDIYATDPSGKGPARLTHDSGTNADPSWSPDHKRIAFHSNRGGRFDIYVMDANGANQVRLTNGQFDAKNPTWSPDGRRLAFEGSPDGNRDIYTMNADGTDLRRLTTDRAEDFDPSWSRDGKIAFASRRDGNYEIYVMNADGADQVRLTSNPTEDFGPDWSPDGTRIAFHSQRNGIPDQIYVMNADGSNPVWITKDDTSVNSSQEYNPAWAPDGHEIVFQANATGNNRDEIWRVSTDGSGLTRLTQSPGFGQVDQVPDW